MAQSEMNATQSTDENEAIVPNHMIIILDKYIGNAEEYALLLSSFCMTMDPTTGLFERNLNKDDIDQSICFNTALLVQLDDVQFMFQAFTDIEKCYNTIEQNQHKRIFFITSGSLGKIIVPSLVKLYPETFPSDNPIFIFCANLLREKVGDTSPTNLWLLEFLENVLPFDHEDDLLARMTREIANYFAAEAQRLVNSQQHDKARQYQDWSTRMLHRHEALMKKK
ncbi:unnamed protein product [Rotaria sp. Silwood1]|nr:unnamed protein product [Rotaria sp. Silwood1]CAF3764982.1 unnamed protein product [Rotaria sp. Silwood1]CAF3884625.1 unnamed protein product [Rotaria sp. Silwood1]CAF3891620.1 unnamed protein product [Rotaria sp. Silwood1]CAF4792120.1 unnamed protein product [Rotaria sp. Silwood1]